MTAEPATAEFRAFPRSWGAEFVREGEVRFRLWAPGEEKLALRLDGIDTSMTRDEDGWFELLATGVRPGAKYAFVLADGLAVPDPAARAQAGDVHGPSLVVDPTAYAWRNASWRGRPWEEAVIYELHIGAFTAEGTFRAAAERLGYLAGLGVTAVEIMPVAQFSGARGWGYDGVLLYAPHPAYGAPDDMKAFVDAAHGPGLMVLLDVVYNHFGPDGNYLPRLAPDFFHAGRHTPWGAAIAYEREPVRRFFIENALYWLEEYNLDGLRLDAIDHIRDEESDPEIVVEIAARIRSEIVGRHVHLTTEDNRNITRLHERDGDGATVLYTAEWNDDVHNVAHVIATGEVGGYEVDFGQARWWKFGRALAQGFAFQGEPSPYQNGKPRGVPSGHLPPTAFVDFIQNHDQIGNRAFGDRLTTLASKPMVEALSAILLLSPHIPLLFMGEEFGETRPFCFFTDFHGELADAVREGRQREFAHHPTFQREAETRGPIPDPNACETFQMSKPDWRKSEAGDGRAWLSRTQRLLRLRHQHVAPLLAGVGGRSGRLLETEEGVIAVDWALSGGLLQLRANLGDRACAAPGIRGEVIFAEPAGSETGDELPPFGVVVAVGRTT